MSPERNKKSEIFADMPQAGRISYGMRLLMISGDRLLASGKRGSFYNTLEEFHHHWERIDVITYPIKTSVPIQYFGNVFVYPSLWPRLFQPLFIFLKGRKLFRETGFDVMIVNEHASFLNGIGAWLLHRATGVPYLLEILHIPGYPRAGTWRESIYRTLLRLFVRFDVRPARAVRVINKKQVPEFLIKAGVPREKLLYIPAFYIDLDIFKPRDVEKKYDFIFAGRLEKNKGLDLFIDAVRLLKEERPEIKALIVGTGPEEKRAKRETRNWKLETNLFFHGWATDSNEVAQLINQSRVLVMLSYNEGGPRVILEAMACGVPVLATSVGIVPDVIEDGVHGGIVSWDAKEIAARMANLLDNPDTYQKYRTNGLELVKQFERRAAIANYAREVQNLVKS